MPPPVLAPPVLAPPPQAIPSPPAFTQAPWNQRPPHHTPQHPAPPRADEAEATAAAATADGEGRRGRNTGLILLVAAGAAALAAGVAWGVATGGGNQDAGNQNSPVVMVQTFDAAQQVAYQATAIKAKASGTSVTVTWNAPATTEGITSYVIVAGLHDKDIKEATVGADKFSATITDLQPGTQYCFSVITLAHPPGDASLRMAKPNTCYQATTDAAEPPSTRA